MAQPYSVTLAEALPNVHQISAFAVSPAWAIPPVRQRMRLSSSWSNAKGLTAADSQIVANDKVKDHVAKMPHSAIVPRAQREARGEHKLQGTAQVAGRAGVAVIAPPTVWTRPQLNL